MSYVCKRKGIPCECATINGYCQVTACIMLADKFGYKLAINSVERMNCDNCVWFVWRGYTEEEIVWLKKNPNCYIKAKICMLGGCDGSRFQLSEAERKDG